MANLAKYTDFRDVEVEDDGGSHNLLFKLNRDILIEQNPVIFPTKTLGKYVNITTGAIVTNASYNTAIIDVADAISVTYITPAMGGINSGYCFINSAGAVILGVKTLTNVLTEIEVPRNAATFVCSWFASADSTQEFKLKTYTTDTAKTILSKYNKTYIYGKEIYSLGDSLSAGGTWQNRLVELTGCVFDGLKNKNKLSIGGTSTLEANFGSGQYRSKVLLNENPTAKYIFVENVNDNNFGNFGNITDRPFMVGDTHILESTFANENAAFTFFNANIVSILESFTAKINTALFFNVITTGKNIKINTPPNVEGQIKIKLGATEYSYAVTTSMSIEDIINLMMETSYLPSYATKIGTDSISFNKETLTFLSTNTGVTATITTANNALYTTGKFFVGELADWTNINMWKTASELSICSKIKGNFEFLCKNFPLATIYIVSFPAPNISSTDFRSGDIFDNDAYVASANYVKFQNLVDIHKEIEKRYKVKHINVDSLCGINGFNFETFFNWNNVHPREVGYYRYAEVISNNL